MRRCLRLCTFLGATLSITPLAYAQSQPAQTPATTSTDLHLNTPIQRTLSGGHTDVFTIQCPTGNFLDVVVNQRGIDVAVSILDPSQKVLITADSPNGAFGDEPASAICNVAGTYTVQVNSPDPKSAAGKYQIILQQLRPATRNDALHIDAETKLFSATILMVGDRTARLHAIDLLQQALVNWSGIENKYEIELCLGTIAALYRATGQSEKALEFYTKALPVQRELGDRKSEAVTLNNTGEMYWNLGQPLKALDFFNLALPVRREVGDRIGEGTTLNDIGWMYWETNQTQKALDFYNQALLIWREAHDRLDEATTLNNMGLVYQRIGQTQKAIDLFNQLLPIQRELKNRRGEEITLGSLGSSYSATGESKKALDLLSQSLLIAREIHDRSDEAIVLDDIGRVYRETGEPQKALDSYNLALPIRREVHDRKGEAATLNNIGLTYSTISEPQKALEYFNQALPMQRELGDLNGLAVTLNNIGLVYWETSQPQKAMEFFQQTVPLWHELGIRSGEATALNNLGTVYLLIGEAQKAIDFYNQALPIRREIGDRHGEEQLLDNIGSAYQNLHQSQKALDFYNQALPVEREIHDRRGEANTLLNIGTANSNMDQPQQALEFYRQALPILQEVGNPTDEAYAWRGIGLARGKLGDSTHEELLGLLAARSLANKVDDPTLRGVVETTLMDYFSDHQQPAVAILFGIDAVNSFQAIRRNMAGLDKNLLADFVQSRSATYRELAELLIRANRLIEAEQVLDLLKTAELSESIQGGIAATAVDPLPLNNAERAALAALNVQTTAAYNSLTRDIPSSTVDTFFQSTLPAMLGKTKHPVAAAPSSLSSMVPALGPGVAAIYTLVGKQQSYLLVTTAHGILLRDVPAGAAQLEKLTGDLRQSLHSSISDSTSILEALSRLLLNPIAADLTTVSKASPDHVPTLLWSLDGSLRYVPVNALFDPRQKSGHRYLIEGARSIIITPESRAHLLDPPTTTNLTVAAFGLSRSYDGLPALVNVDRELHAIVKTPQSSNAPLTGELLHNDAFTLAALESSLKENFPVVHIASHFVFKPGDSADSYLLLGGDTTGGQGYELTLLKLDTDPALNFTNTRLLTLSACSTAASDTASNGREMDSLGMVMQQRGAAAVLATLWDVNDASTSLLMSDFYRRWAGTPGITKIEALRQAQISMLTGPKIAAPHSSTGRGTTVEGSTPAATGYANPYYWAPFILIGNFR